MQLFAYSVYDNKALIYAPPFFAVGDGAAIRSFQDLSNDLDTTVGRHPADFSLFCVGTYNDAKGELLGVVPVRHVIDANALLRIQPRLPLTDTEREAFVSANGHAPPDELAFKQPDGSILKGGKF